jgi:hypothetical protein
MPRKLRYSERKAIAEQGGLGPLTDEPDSRLRNALLYLYIEAAQSACGDDFKAAMQGACVKHFGWAGDTQITQALHNPGGGIEVYLDLIEIFCEQAATEHWVYAGMTEYKTTALKDAGGELNGLFDRHRFGYRLQDGEIVKIGSPVLDEVVTGPALLASQRPGWEEVERTYKEALHRQRGGVDENDDALTAACATVEAALKAVGYRGTHLGPLAKSFKEGGTVPPELAGVPEALDVLLKRIGAVRNQHSDSHGKHAGADEVPQALVDLTVHWAGAFIVYVSATHP